MREISNNPTERLNISRFEKIGHYLNKLIRTVTHRYVGYEFSILEAKEAINNGFKGLFTDENIRLAQDIENNTHLVNKMEFEPNSEQKILRQEDLQLVMDNSVVGVSLSNTMSADKISSEEKILPKQESQVIETPRRVTTSCSERI